MSPDQRKALIEAALEARSNAYAPYSVYRVGSAALSGQGGVFAGCNVENVSFGLTVCAERNAIAALVLAGNRDLAAIALATQDGAAPCGACLQVMSEFADGPAMPVLLANAEGSVEETTLGALFPRGFSTSGLERG